jgi:hypothetical protein
LDIDFHEVADELTGVITPFTVRRDEGCDDDDAEVLKYLASLLAWFCVIVCTLTV